MTAMQMRPSAQQVATAWIKTVPELAGIDVASTLAPVGSWKTQDFIVVGAGLGGIPQTGVMVRSSVLQVTVFAKRPNSDRPAWNRASMTSEAIRDATYGSYQFGALEIPGGFLGVNLHSVEAMSEPRRGLGDPAAMALYSIDLLFVYDPAGLVVV